MTAVQALDLSAVVISNTLSKGPYTNLSEIAKVTEGSFESPLASSLNGLFDSMQKEGIIRNSAGLLSPRQNLYTIILAAQGLDAATNVAGEQRAVTLVWRDPYPMANPPANQPPARIHCAFVRFFKWLTD